MTNNLIFLGSIGSAFCLGQMDLGPYAGFKDIGVTAILGFVVWYTFTKMNGTLEKILEKLGDLDERLPKNQPRCSKTASSSRSEK